MIPEVLHLLVELKSSVPLSITVAGRIGINNGLKLTGKPKLTERNFGRSSGGFKSLFVYPEAQVEKVVRKR
ncbi:MAG: hypothetical protein A3B91_04185 [Candidatus Yanofskybacteria bacterium RIFCSPHIGHO2_02_FULL_41_29]|uniref:Uncharacterized protein n=1 Tax=Candidatus Yanofskybacteria bacterium RIFCSPHIGHO2_01_FULL_41_53 TaxID=1802663 RepID=A0A1F8EGL2_9BACT|nr:MAG: hypothetical protein A2650_02900 [Candidatus Yanofskybacteria bacterium RIFCSPHIGHO2_01_FULL_41_53]OGN10500.1 MAG: hypothetical protein A3B91_04185 [Candidatus Yanofskybacteria bacterium RIFCSPHIGHO2_02_FULL_41_29]OGN18801.1 MAG: hypothetical protein A3F48_02410 [Candidatus Yanofskybacteria bacterium RIFCSPHIGHO2_12_FULL_41_9]OGN21547.1 MAG: hypothetical protein A2916_04665 [Candidatus Yanofskybacteria bacterium RIFCSPLOWO2_01_FULL_41_67]OGN29687.1 MAG: hypothetical protein A3H54_02885 